MPINLTSPQRDAVKLSGNILVAAAAGSGKTAVLVERIIKKLCDRENPVNADRLLIVTFTNAAAAEMRGRIEKRLDEVIAEDPNNASLIQQKYLLSSAKICTIDSFCIDLVRENFEVLDISPDFTLVEASSLKPIYREIISQITNEYLAENNQEFLNLLDLIGSEYDEGDFAEFIIGLYEYSRQLPDPEGWFDYICSLYSNGRFTTDNYWGNYALDKALKTSEALKDMLSRAIDLIGVEARMADKFMPVFIEAGNLLERLYVASNSRSWDAVYHTLKELYFPSLPSVRGSNDIPEIKSAKEIYDYIKNSAINDLSELFYADGEFINTQFTKIYPLVLLLCEILKEFDSKVYLRLKEDNIFTFHNTEALALKLLTGEKGGEFLNLYDEVCVDEYQDTNDLQNMLFSVLSNNDSRLFAVGDVKQSIYGFRGANPRHFIEKKKNHVSIENSKEGDPIKIILGNNFRSRPQVCDFINYFFSIFMTENTGEIVYDAEEMLISSGKFENTDFPKVTVDIIETKGEDRAKKVLEAARIAQFIKKTMGEGAIISQKNGCLRPAKYSDFVILLRSMKNNADVITEELRRHGIPVNYSKEGFCEFTEVAVMLSLLKVIDNPTNEIELLSVLMSPIFGFTSEEMAKLRIDSRNGNLYSAVITASQMGNTKAQKFVDTIDRFRLYAVTLSVPKLMETLLEETDYLNTVLAYKDGERRKNNLLLLLSYAEGYYKTSQKGIAAFVDYIVKQSQSGIKSATAQAYDDTVKIMSIHGSKGLQFPVCIIANTSVQFNTADTRSNNIYSVKHGIGFKYFDEADKARHTTLSRQAIADRLKLDRLEEELRLFYVALTRTQDILYITGTVSNAEKKLGIIKNKLIGADSRLSTDIWNNTASYLEWILIALLLHPDGKALRGNGTSVICRKTDSRVVINIITGDSIPEAENIVNDRLLNSNPILTREISENIAYKYPFEEILKLSSKTSVSALSHKAQSEEYGFSTKPAFVSAEGISSAGKGTAMHKVMEFFDFSSWNSVSEELERLLEWQFISETEFKSLDIKALETFFAGKIFGRIKNAKLIKREMKFITEVPATQIDSTIDQSFNDENIIIQGAVDVCFIEEDGVVILDFKTDKASKAQYFIDTYKEQLEIYAMACEKIFGLPVKEKLIYSFFLSQEIEI